MVGYKLAIKMIEAQNNTFALYLWWKLWHALFYCYIQITTCKVYVIFYLPLDQHECTYHTWICTNV